jgi:signal transduction histidine kinase
VQESLTNVVKHASATKADVKVSCCDKTVRVTVQDDGDGFDCAVAGDMATDSGHLGLRAMREMVESQGGSLDVSSEKGKGTTVVAQFPRAD